MAQNLKKKRANYTLPAIAAVISLLSALFLVWLTFAGEPIEKPGEADNFTATVGTPIDMDRTKALAVLQELSGEDDNIDYIFQHEVEYSTELLMAAANNPEKAAFVRGYAQDERDIIVARFTVDELESDCPLLLQWDERWGYGIYGSSVIGMTGCGPTCMSMVVLALTGDDGATPDQLAYWAEDNGYYAEGAGTSWTYIAAQAEEYGLTARELPLWEASIMQALDSGALIVCAVGEGDFTTEGHYIVITGYDDNGFSVNDPNCIYRSGIKWSYEQLEGQIRNLWAVE